MQPSTNHALVTELHIDRTARLQRDRRRTRTGRTWTLAGRRTEPVLAPAVACCGC